MFARMKIMPTFATAIRKKFFLIQQMGRKLATFLMLKKAFEKKVCKKFLKNLVV